MLVRDVTPLLLKTRSLELGLVIARHDGLAGLRLPLSLSPSLSHPHRHRALSPRFRSCTGASVLLETLGAYTRVVLRNPRPRPFAVLITA